ncbi:hypothetical protein [Halobaculum lipolyticum]|uniref:Uncharacterized protein n=1 Tax=Halobaculum lipolyticum TaxID=3032001 RepID=A0ABD5WE58_9EURY|nr:hypothetical protein [Halobaculum sp. DT31]
MGGFDFDDGADDHATDGGPAFAAAADAADTVVSPAEPAPLADPGSLGSDDASGGADRAAVDAVDAVDATLLYAGETPRATLPVANGHLVATSHRVLAHAPDSDGRATLRTVHRVNVEEVRLSATGVDWLVRPIAYCVIGGLAMVLGGSLVSFDAMSTTMPEGAGATGVGGLLSMVGGVLAVLGFVDDALRVVGALSLLVGAALMGVYAYTRGSEVVVETEGETPTLRVDAGDADDDAVERFRAEAGLENGDTGRLKRLVGR